MRRSLAKSSWDNCLWMPHQYTWNKKCRWIGWFLLYHCSEVDSWNWRSRMFFASRKQSDPVTTGIAPVATNDSPKSSQFRNRLIQCSQIPSFWMLDMDTKSWSSSNIPSFSICNSTIAYMTVWVSREGIWDSPFQQSETQFSGRICMLE